jgi:hypothetical protein
MFLVFPDDYSLSPEHTLRVRHIAPSENHVIAGCGCSRAS